jgi:hypothetical protein
MTTTTVQLTEASQGSTEVLRLHAGPQTFEEKLKSMIAEMQEACQTLPPPMAEAMQKNFAEWESQFFLQYNPKKPTDREKIQSAMYLCALYFRVEALMLHAAQSHKAQLAWHKFHTQLKEHLSKILPSERPAEPFIAEYRQRELDKKYLVQIAKMKDFFQKLRDQMYLHANNINEEMMTGFETIQSEMIKVQEATNLSTEQIYQRMDELTKSVTQLFLGFREHMKGMKGIADLLQLHGITLEHTLNDAHRVLNKV